MRKLFALFALAPALLLAGCNTADSSFKISKDTVEISGNYQGGDIWKYLLVTDLPTPCHSVTVLPSVSKDEPKVTLAVRIVQPGSDQVCIQVIAHKEMEGTFTAGPDIKVYMTVQTSN